MAKGKKTPKIMKTETAAAVDNQTLAKREFTPAEKERLARYEQRLSIKSINFDSLKDKLDRGKIVCGNPDDPLLDVKLFETFGTPDLDLQLSLLDQIASVLGAYAPGACKPKIIIAAINSALAILGGIRPQNELEAMLVIQMVGVHNIAMKVMSSVMLDGQTLQGKESNATIATKMLRTFTAQMEVLQRLRTGGQQKMTIKHVHVNKGGQAIVGNIAKGGSKNDKNHE